MIIEDETGRTWTTAELRDRDREPDEPEPEPPVDLAEVEQLLRQRYAEFVDEQREAVRLLLDELVPQMAKEIKDLREQLARRDALETRIEWAVTSGLDAPPWDRPGTRWHTDPEAAQREYALPGQLWSRTVTIEAAVPISAEPPF